MFKSLKKAFKKESSPDFIDPDFKERCLKYIFGNLYGGLYEYKPMNVIESSNFIEEIRYESKKALHYTTLLDFIQTAFESKIDKKDLELLL